MSSASIPLGGCWSSGEGASLPAAPAAAVGLADYRTWRRTYRRSTGESPKLVRLPQRLPPDFDDRTWHHAWRRTLPVAAARELLKRLRRLGSTAPVPLPGGETAPAVKRSSAGVGAGTEDEAREAVEQAAAGIRERLLDDAEGLPPNLVRVLGDLAENLFDPEFSGPACRERTGVPDTAVSTRVRFYLGDSLLVLLEKLRVEIAMRHAGDLRFSIERLAEAVGWSSRHLLDACHRRAGAPVGEVRKTLRRTADDPGYRLWCRAGRGALSRAGVLALENFLRRLHPEALAPPSPASLAVRTDVDPRRVAGVLELYRAVSDPGALKTLDHALRTHPDYSAARWYSHWVRDRLGRESLDAAWEDWRIANRDLEELLRQPGDQRVELVQEVRKFHSDAFLWLLVDCVEVRLFHDGAESEDYADLAVAASEARWLVDRRPESAGFRGLMLALKANAVQRRDELDEASETFKRAMKAAAACDAVPWIRARVLSLYASHLDRRGETKSMLAALAQAARQFKQTGDLLERLRCLVKRCPAWFSSGRDPSRFLTRCIDILQETHPFAGHLLQTAHGNRLLACIYLRDQLTGVCLAPIRRYRSAIPNPSSPYMATNYRQVDGLIAALEGQRQRAEVLLREAASWYEENNLPNDAAVAWMQYSWVILESDSAAARSTAIMAFSYMEKIGFNSSRSRDAAFQILHEAQRRTLRRETLRTGIVLAVCPKARLISRPAGQPAASRLDQ